MSEYTKAFNRVLFEKSPLRIAVWLLIIAYLCLGAISLFKGLDTGGVSFALGAALLILIGAVMTERSAPGGSKLLFIAVGLAFVLSVFEVVHLSTTERATAAAYAAEDRQTTQLRNDLQALCERAGGKDLGDPVCMNLDAVLSNHREAGRALGGLPPRTIE